MCIFQWVLPLTITCMCHRLCNAIFSQHHKLPELLWKSAQMDFLTLWIQILNHISFLTIHGTPTFTESITTCMIQIIVAASNIGLPSALETSRVGISVLPDCLWGLFWPNLKIKSQVPVLKSKLCEPFHSQVIMLFQHIFLPANLDPVPWIAMLLLTWVHYY